MHDDCGSTCPGLDKGNTDDPNFNFVMEPIFKQDKTDQDFSVKVGLNYPIVAIGAPVKSYLPAIGQLLNSEVIIPDIVRSPM